LLCVYIRYSWIEVIGCEGQNLRRLWIRNAKGREQLLEMSSSLEGVLFGAQFCDQDWVLDYPRWKEDTLSDQEGQNGR
jgi:hypothetical protein